MNGIVYPFSLVGNIGVWYLGHHEGHNESIGSTVSIRLHSKSNLVHFSKNQDRKYLWPYSVLRSRIF